jgi:hypothetical protein
MGIQVRRIHSSGTEFGSPTSIQSVKVSWWSAVRRALSYVGAGFTRVFSGRNGGCNKEDILTTELGKNQQAANVASLPSAQEVDKEGFDKKTVSVDLVKDALRVLAQGKGVSQPRLGKDQDKMIKAYVKAVKNYETPQQKLAEAAKEAEKALNDAGEELLEGLFANGNLFDSIPLEGNPVDQGVPNSNDTVEMTPDDLKSTLDRLREPISSHIQGQLYWSSFEEDTGRTQLLARINNWAVNDEAARFFELRLATSAPFMGVFPELHDVTILLDKETKEAIVLDGKGGALSERFLLKERSLDGPSPSNKSGLDFLKVIKPSDGNDWKIVQEASATQRSLDCAIINSVKVKLLADIRSEEKGNIPQDLEVRLESLKERRGAKDFRKLDTVDILRTIDEYLISHYGRVNTIRDQVIAEKKKPLPPKSSGKFESSAGEMESFDSDGCVGTQRDKKTSSDSLKATDMQDWADFSSDSDSEDWILYDTIGY